MTPSARFTFPLQRVLELRAEHEQAAAARLAGAASDADRARAAMDAIAVLRAAGSEALARATATTASVGHLRQIAFVLDHVDGRLADAGNLVLRHEAQEAHARQEHQEALRLRRMVDRLRDRRLAEWQMDRRRHDQVLMDALAVERHVRPPDSASQPTEPAA